MKFKKWIGVSVITAALSLGAVTSVAQDSQWSVGDEVDQQQWWNPADWFDSSSAYNTDYDDYDYERDYYTDDYYDDAFGGNVGYDAEGGINWGGGDDWGYDDSSWGIDDDYWEDDWGYDSIGDDEW